MNEEYLPTARELAEKTETDALYGYARRLFQVQVLLETAAETTEHTHNTGNLAVVLQLAADLLRGVEEALKQAADRRE